MLRGVECQEPQTLQLPLRSSRLTLRALTIDDLDEHARLFRDPAVVQFLYEEPLDRAEAAVHLERRLAVDLPDEGGWLNLAVERDGTYVGEVGVSLVSRSHRHCEIGYMFLPEAQGHGFATEAAAVMVDLAVESMGAHRVTGRLDARNAASAAVLTRLGMRHEGHLRENEFVKGEWTDEAIYAVTEDEWRVVRERLLHSGETPSP